MSLSVPSKWLHAFPLYEIVFFSLSQPDLHPIGGLALGQCLGTLQRIPICPALPLQCPHLPSALPSWGHRLFHLSGLPSASQIASLPVCIALQLIGDQAKPSHSLTHSIALQLIEHQARPSGCLTHCTALQLIWDQAGPLRLFHPLRCPAADWGPGVARPSHCLTRCAALQLIGDQALRGPHTVSPVALPCS